MSSAFQSPVLLSSRRSAPRAVSRSRASPCTPVCALTRQRTRVKTVSERELSALAGNRAVVVLKCFAKYCAGCRGVEPKFRKIAAAYEAGDNEEGRVSTVEFCEIDYAANEEFCRDVLGVKNLPFFGIWANGEYIGGEAMGWKVVGSKLVEKIDSAVESAKLA